MYAPIIAIVKLQNTTYILLIFYNVEIPFNVVFDIKPLWDFYH